MYKVIFNKPNAARCASVPRNKELVNTWSIYARNSKGENVELIDARCYMGRSASASVVYACVWINNQSAGHPTGRGDAGGYGYHKESAAIADALSAAGVELYGLADAPRWDYNNARAYTAKEQAQLKRAANKKRAYFGGAGDSAVRTALLSIAHVMRDENGKKYKNIFLGR